MSAPSYADALRILDLISILRQHAPPALRIGDLADRLGVSTKTIGRYVRAVEDGHETSSGRPLLRRERRGNSSWVVLEPSGWQAADLMRYAVVNAAADAVRPEAADGNGRRPQAHNAGHRADGRRPRRQLRATIDQRILDRVRAGIHYVPADAERLPVESILGVMLEGTVLQRAVDVQTSLVTSSNGCEPRGSAAHRRALRIEPYTLVMHRDALYVVGRAWTPCASDDLSASRPPADAVVVTLALDAIRSASLTELEFELPADYSPERHFAHDGAPRERTQWIELAFRGEAAQQAKRRRWPGQHSWQELGNERSLLRMQTSITPELLGWILSWGDNVEIREPASLRDRVRETLENALRRYE